MCTICNTQINFFWNFRYFIVLNESVGFVLIYRPHPVCDRFYKIARNAKRLIVFVPRIGDDDSLCKPGRKSATPGSTRDTAGAAPGCTRDACATSCRGCEGGPAAPGSPGPTSLVENGRLSLQLAPGQRWQFSHILSRSCYDGKFRPKPYKNT
jgi:hypothetical protein